MSSIDYDSIAELYDRYVTADYDVPFFTAEVLPERGPVLELAAGTGRPSLPLIEPGRPRDAWAAGGGLRTRRTGGRSRRSTTRASG